MVEASAAGPCKGSGAGVVAVRVLTMASGFSYSGSCSPDAAERYIVMLLGF